MDIEDVVMIVVVAVLVVIVGYGLIFTAVSMSTERSCLQLGWANYSVDYKLTGYCVREENEYEIVEPLKELETYK